MRIIISNINVMRLVKFNMICSKNIGLYLTSKKVLHRLAHSFTDIPNTVCTTVVGGCEVMKVVNENL